MLIWGFFLIEILKFDIGIYFKVIYYLYYIIKNNINIYSSGIRV